MNITFIAFAPNKNVLVPSPNTLVRSILAFEGVGCWFDSGNYQGYVLTQYAVLSQRILAQLK